MRHVVRRGGGGTGLNLLSLVFIFHAERTTPSFRNVSRKKIIVLYLRFYTQSTASDNCTKEFSQITYICGHNQFHIHLKSKGVRGLIYDSSVCSFIIPSGLCLFYSQGNQQRSIKKLTLLWKKKGQTEVTSCWLQAKYRRLCWFESAV